MFTTSARLLTGLLACLAFSHSHCFSQIEIAGEPVTISTAWSLDAAKPGQQVVLAVVLDIADGYYVGNAEEHIAPADQKLIQPTQVQLAPGAPSAENVKIGSANFPGATNETEQFASKLKGNNTVYVPVNIPEDQALGQIRLNLSIGYQACDESVCFAPREIKRTLTLDVKNQTAEIRGCPNPALFLRWSDRRAKQISQKSTGTDYKSKEPPVGPPWVRDLQVAQEMALRKGCPIFLYSTKTFCPHCVVVETDMLSSPELQPYYEKAVWLYVYRDFKGGPEDQKAERIGVRYSLSSWPQLWLIDPHNLSIITEVGRSVESFAEAVAKTEVLPTNDLSAIEPLLQSEATVVAFQNQPTKKTAAALLESNDVVAQLFAARYLSQNEQWNELTKRSAALLSVPNDSLRFETLKAIAKTGSDEAKHQVMELVVNPSPSRNPNVLLSHAIQALASCGDADSISTIAPHALGTARNMTTKVAVDAMKEIAERHPACTDEVVTALANSFPPIEPKVKKLVETRAQQVHQKLVDLTGHKVEFPSEYTEATRTELRNSWSKK